MITNKLKPILQNNLFKSGGVYTLSAIVEKAIPFLLLPVLTRYLTTTDYGIVAMFTLLVGIVVPVIGLATNASILRYFYKEDIDFPVFVTNGLFIVLGGTVVVALIFIIFPELISKYTGLPRSWLFLVVLVGAGQMIIEMVTNIWMALKKPWFYGIFRILLTACNLGLSVLLIVKYHYGWQGRLIGMGAAVVVFALIGFYILWKNRLIKPELNKYYLKLSLKYSSPLVFHLLSGLVLSMIDRLFITNMIGLKETGIYTVGYQIGMMLGVLAAAFSNAWTPWLFEKLKEGHARIKVRIVNMSYVFMAAMLVLALLMTISAPWFMKLFVGKDFYAATKFIGWVSLGYAFSGMYAIVSKYILYAERTVWLSIMTVSSALLNIGLNFILIKKNGAIGAAQATALTMLVVFIATWGIAIKAYPMPWFHFLQPSNKIKKET